ncbi:MAG: hypothetical protein GF329_19575 [Candidatus Lokiarchaeota archaeon]|nr:hypothetical protein [Candidatus Lokiarchaeota archaeon]
MEIEIMPNRLLNDYTAIKFLNKLRKIDGVLEIMIYGPRFKKRTIYLGKNEVRLIVKVGRFWVVINKKDKEDILSDINAICSEIFNFGYSIQPRRFVKKQKSLCDYLYGGPPILKGFLINEEYEDEAEDQIIEFDEDFIIDDEK